MGGQYALFFGCCLLFLYCDAAASWWGQTWAWKHGLPVLLLAPVAYFSFAWLCNRVQLAVASPAVNLGMAVGGVIIGIWINKDELNALQWSGIALALLAIMLLLTGHPASSKP